MYQVVATGAAGEHKTSAHNALIVNSIMPGTASDTPPSPAQPWVNEVLAAAQRAEEAAARAETGGGGSGGPGEDGGYYRPSVTDGVLTWTPSKADMPGVPESDIRGPKGDPGTPGKTAYQYAQDGGYTGTEAEFAAKLAQELPEPYTLPVATADTLGGMMPGKGLTADEDGRVSVEPDSEYELIEAINIDEEITILTRSKEPNGKEYNFQKIYIDIKTPQGTEKKVGVVSLNSRPGVIPIAYLNNLIETHTQGGWGKVFAHIDGKILRGQCACSMNGESHLTWTNGNLYMRGFGEKGIDNIHYLQAGIISGKFPSGTIIEIWGVRSK